MKNQLQLLAFWLTISLLLPVIIRAQAPVKLWDKTLGGPNNEYAYSIVPTSDGGFILCGNTSSTTGDVTGGNKGRKDIWVVKLNGDGNKSWDKTLGGSLDDEASSIIQTSDGGYILCGYTRSKDGDVTGGNKGNADIWIIKLTATGVISWDRTLGGTSDDYATSIVRTLDGGYIVCGYSYSTNGDVTGINKGGGDVWVVRLNADGTKSWDKTFGGSSYDDAKSIVQTSDGGYILCGFTGSTDGDVSGGNKGSSDVWVIKLSANGIKIWDKTLGGSNSDDAKSIIQTSDGGYILCGFTGSNDGDISERGINGQTSAWVIKLSIDGIKNWDRRLGDIYLCHTGSVRQTLDRGFILCGFTYSKVSDVIFNDDRDAWIIKLNANGTNSWDKRIGGSGDETAYSIEQTVDGGYILCGNTGKAGVQADVWVARLAKDSPTTSCNHTVQINAPTGTSLCVGTAATLSANVSGGTGPFTYQWKSSTGGLNTTSQLTVSQADSYTIEVADAAGCVQLATIIISQKNSPSATVTTTGLTTVPTGSSLSVILTTPAVSGQTYQWFRDGQAIASATNNTYLATMAGGYTVTVNRDGCSATSAVTRLAVGGLSLSVAGNTTFCAGNSATVVTTVSGGTAPYTFRTQLGTSTPLTTTNTTGIHTVVSSATGVHSLTVTDGQGIIGTRSVVFTSLPTPIASITANGSLVLPPGGSVILSTSAVAGYTYQWFRTGAAITGATGATYTANGVGNYTVTVTQNGCSATSAAVTVGFAPSVIIASATSLCAGQSATLTTGYSNASLPITYQWLLNGATIAGATDNRLVLTTPGAYAVAITDARGLTAVSAPFTVVQKPAPNVTVSTSGSTSLLTGTSTVLSVTTVAGQTYQWYKDGAAISGAAGSSYTVVTAGNYTITIVRDGCSATSTATVVSIILAAEHIVPGVSLSVSPNPVTGYVQVVLQLDESAPATLRFLDMQGRVLQRQALERSERHHEHRFEVGNVPGGLYLIQAQVGDKQVTRKIVKY